MQEAGPAGSSLLEEEAPQNPVPVETHATEWSRSGIWGLSFKDDETRLEHFPDVAVVQENKKMV